MGENILEHPSQLTGNILKRLTLEADIFSGIPRESHGMGNKIATNHVIGTGQEKI